MISSLLSGNFNFIDFIISILISIPAVLIAISVHEAAHAFVAYKLGDPTARLMGRVTINPIAHFDLVGALFMLIFGFGWAKPVPFDLRMLKHPKRDTALIAAAGPVSNFIVGFLFSGIMYAMVVFGLAHNPMLLEAGTIFSILLQMVECVVVLNLSLMVFNLIPLSPLDGSKVVISLLPRSAHRFILNYERYGMPILMIWLLISDYLPWFLSLDTLHGWITNNVLSAVFDVWDFVFGLFV